jgi:UDP-galactopyranose mutase
MLKQSPEKPVRNRIDLSIKELARHWCKHFGVSQDELETAMAKVGDNAETVMKELSKSEWGCGAEWLECSVVARVAAGAFAFLIFSHAFDGPDLYGASSFFETMPSRPRLAVRFEHFHAVAFGDMTYWTPRRVRLAEPISARVVQ